MQSSFGATDLKSYFERIGEEFSEQSWYSDLTSFSLLPSAQLLHQLGHEHQRVLQWSPGDVIKKVGHG